LLANLGVVKTTLTEGRIATAAAVTMKGGGEQFNGREDETAALLSRRPLTLSLRVAVSPHVISTVGCFVVFRNGFSMKRFNLKTFVIFAALLSAFGITSLANAQNQNGRDWQAKVVAAFGSQCATENFPKKQLRSTIKRAMWQLKDVYSRPESDGKFSVAYDLDGDGQIRIFCLVERHRYRRQCLLGRVCLKARTFFRHYFRGTHLLAAARERLGGIDGFFPSKRF